MRSKQSTSREAATSAAHKYVEAFRKAYPQKSVTVHPMRNASGGYVFRVVIDGSGGERPLEWGELVSATQDFLR